MKMTSKLTKKREKFGQKEIIESQKQHQKAQNLSFLVRFDPVLTHFDPVLTEKKAFFQPILGCFEADIDKKT